MFNSMMKKVKKSVKKGVNKVRKSVKRVRYGNGRGGSSCGSHTKKPTTGTGGAHCGMNHSNKKNGGMNHHNKKKVNGGMSHNKGKSHKKGKSLKKKGKKSLKNTGGMYHKPSKKGLHM